jgi:hypothetical protein
VKVRRGRERGWRGVERGRVVTTYPRTKYKCERGGRRYAPSREGTWPQSRSSIRSPPSGTLCIRLVFFKSTNWGIRTPRVQ